MFSNSILAGEELVRTAIRSANYVAGVSGWRIDRLGNAEFNSGTFRGTVLVTGPNGSVQIYVDPVVGSVVSFTDVGGGIWNLFAQLVAGTNHELALLGPGPDAVGFLATSDPTAGSTFGIFADVVRFVSVNGIYDAEAWQTASLVNGWANVGGVQPPASYRRRGRAVDIRGVVSSAAAFQTVFTLPPAYRPAYNHIYPCNCSGSTVGEIAVTAATGAVSIVQGFPAASTATALSGVVPID